MYSLIAVFYMSRAVDLFCLAVAVRCSPPREKVFRLSAGLLDVQRLTRGRYGATR